MRLSFSFTICSALILIFHIPSIPAEKTESPNFLLIHSYSPYLPWSSLFDRGFRNALADAYPVKINLFTEWLDHRRIPNAWRGEEFYAFLRKKYKKLNIDVVVTGDYLASEFVAELPADLFGDPIVISTGSLIRPVKTAPQFKSYHWLFTKHEYQKGLDFALSLHPQTERIIFLLDKRPEAEKRLSEIRLCSGIYGDNYEIVYITDFSMEELIFLVKNLKKNDLVFYGLILEDNTGKRFVPREVARKISENATAPVYSFWDTMIGTGVVGGYMVSAELSGGRAAKLALKSHFGDELSPRDLLPENQSAYLLDWNAAKRFNINIKDISHDVTIRNRKPTFYEQYRLRIFVTVGFIKT